MRTGRSMNVFPISMRANYYSIRLCACKLIPDGDRSDKLAVQTLRNVDKRVRIDREGSRWENPPFSRLQLARRTSRPNAWLLGHKISQPNGCEPPGPGKDVAPAAAINSRAIEL